MLPALAGAPAYTLLYEDLRLPICGRPAIASGAVPREGVTLPYIEWLLPMFAPWPGAGSPFKPSRGDMEARFRFRGSWPNQCLKVFKRLPPLFFLLNEVLALLVDRPRETPPLGSVRKDC